MSKRAEILDQLQDQLKASAFLSYVDDTNILSGARPISGIIQFPMIVIEPSGWKEADYTYPKQKITMTVAVVGFINCTNKDKQIVGDTTDRGIMDFENDILKAISSDITLAGYAIWAKPSSGVYSEPTEYPVRSFVINVEILFEQVATTR
jgi:hypothetical protein